MKRALLKSCNLLGDGLYIGPVAAAWYKKHGAEFDEVHLLTIPNHAYQIYEGMGVPWKVVFGPEGAYDFEFDFDVGKAFQITDKRKCHLVNGYAELIGMPEALIPAKPNYKPPALTIPEEWKGLILLSMHSLSCACRENPPRPPNKMLPWIKWKPLLVTLREELPQYPIRIIGSKTDLVPREAEEWLGITPENYLLGVPIPEQAVMMQYAKMLITVDNGLAHLAASQGLPEFIFVPACLAMYYSVPWGHKHVRAVHMDPVTVNAASLNWQLLSAIRDFRELKLL